jgi:CRP/FNR family transcriptional regulator, nitrogen fixation regulation protein
MRFELTASERPRGIVQLEARNILFHQGDAATAWYEVVAGVISTSHLSGDGARQLTGYHYPGDVVGLDHAQYQETAETVTASLLRVHSGICPPPPLHGAACNGMVDCAARRALASTKRCLFLFGKKGAMQRVAALLLDITSHAGDDADVAQLMQRGEVADHLGLTLHTVSRAISELSRRGLIARDGAHLLRIVDRAGLAMLADVEGSEPAILRPSL